MSEFIMTYENQVAKFELGKYGCLIDRFQQGKPYKLHSPRWNTKLYDHDNCFMVRYVSIKL